MKKVYLILSFLCSITLLSSAFAHTRLNEKNPKIIKLLNSIEKKLKNSAELEILLMSYPVEINHLRHIKLTKIQENIRHLEIVAAILTEKYRKEIALFKDKTGALWLSQGSHSAVLPPQKILNTSGKVDYVFHTHPARGEVHASSGDLSSIRFDINARASIINMTGQKIDYFSDRSITKKRRTFIPVSYSSEVSSELINRDLEIERLSSVYDRFLTLKMFLKKKTDKKQAVIGEMRRLLERSYHQNVTHSSFPKKKLSSIISSEIELLSR